MEKASRLLAVQEVLKMSKTDFYSAWRVVSFRFRILEHQHSTEL